MFVSMKKTGDVQENACFDDYYNKNTEETLKQVAESQNRRKVTVAQHFRQRRGKKASRLRANCAEFAVLLTIAWIVLC